MSELADRTIVITGANSGIGQVAARELARQGARVIVACRSREKSQPVVEEIRREAGNDRVELVALDLGDLASVRACANELLGLGCPIHVLVNNAGLAGQRGVTRDGFEVQFGTNHLGHYLLTRLLLDRIVASGPARIVNVSSASHYNARKPDWAALRQRTRSLTAMREYSVSKLANVLFTKELARRLEGTKVTTYALHPGVVATGVWRRVPGPLRWAMKRFMISPEEGARSTLRCATAPELAGETGRYYDLDGGERQPSKLADDAALAAELWTRSAEWTGLPA
jgi:NAD(P)-dependent dehydrogenase (short-subunit alcohol dehydrogenase family)